MHVRTSARAAQIFDRDEDTIWELSGQFEPEDGMLWVLRYRWAEILAFTEFCIENLQEIIKDQIGKIGRSASGRFQTLRTVHPIC